MTGLSDMTLALMNTSGNKPSTIRTARMVTYGFKKIDPQAIAWSRQYAAELVADISNTTRIAVRRAVTAGFTKGKTVRQTAKIIQQSVGLHERQVDAVIKLRDKLIESTGGRIKAGKTIIRIPEGGLNAQQIDKRVQQYADRLLKQRTLDIARTETMKVANEGQRQSWMQAIRKGELTGKEKRIWLVADPCPICAALADTLADMFGPFPGGLMGPPAHPKCECTQGLQP
jgi:hypothetical protein